MILIGGLPRSGTSLMGQLIDGADGILQLVGEAESIAKYYFGHFENADQLNVFNASKEGRLLSVHYLEAKSEKFGINFEDTWDVARASNAVETMFRGISGQKMKFLELLSVLDKMIASGYGEYSKESLIKVPLYGETLFRCVVEHAPQSKFIYMSRASSARFRSSWCRRIKEGRCNIGVTNGLDTIVANFLMEIASRVEFLKVKAEFGGSVVTEVPYERLIADGAKVMSEICEFVGSNTYASMLEPTFMGGSRRKSGAHPTKIINTELDTTEHDREIIDFYDSLTSYMGTPKDLRTTYRFDKMKFQYDKRFHLDSDASYAARINFFNALDGVKLFPHELSAYFWKRLRKHTSLLF